MPVEKLSVSIERKLAKNIRRAAGKAGKSISGWLAEAADRQLLIEQAKLSLDEWETENGRITEAQLGEVAAKWPA